MSQYRGVPEPLPLSASRLKDLSDGDLVGRLRVSAREAEGVDRAIAELRQRHLPAAERYADLYTHGAHCARDLAREAFDMACVGLRRGTDLKSPIRLRVLRNVHHAAVGWSAGPQQYRLLPHMSVWADASATASRPAPWPGPLNLRSTFERLSPSHQSTLWYCLVERELPASVAVLAGVPLESVAVLAAKAMAELRSRLLTAATITAKAECRGFVRLLEVCSVPGEKRTSPELDQHLMHCQRCAGHLDVQRSLTTSAPSALAEALLPHSGRLYAAACSGSNNMRRDHTPDVIATIDQPGAPASIAVGGPLSPERRRGRRLRPPLARRVCVTVASLAAITLTARVTLSGAAAPTQAHPGHTRVPTAAPGPQLHTPVSTAPPIPRPSETSPASQPTPASSPRTPVASAALPGATVPTGTGSPAPASGSAAPPPPELAAGGYTRVINAASGLCLDSASAQPADNVQVVMAECDGSATQQWQLDGQGLIHNSAAPSYCLDTRGQTYKHLDLWTCSSVASGTGNLSFETDSSARIRPIIATGDALTPCGTAPGSLLGLQPVSTTKDNLNQRWS